MSYEQIAFIHVVALEALCIICFIWCCWKRKDDEKIKP